MVTAPNPLSKPTPSRKTIYGFWAILTLIAACLIFIRSISSQFILGTTTFDHPYIAFIGALLIGGLAWLCLISLIRSLALWPLSKRLLWGSLFLSLGLRAMFFGSTSIYENDWNRYLWDGAVLEKGHNPYRYSPADVDLALDLTDDNLQSLSKLSQSHDEFANRINYPELTTIYTPLTQLIFVSAAKIEPLNLDALRLVFLIIEAATLFLMVKALALYERSKLWVLIYALNPILIYASFNAVHMDILLAPFILLSFIFIKQKPYWAAVALGLAAGIKLWSLVLAPILFRRWNAHPKTYLISAFIVCAVFILSLLPMLLSLQTNSGLIAYAGEWQKSAWLFPMISDGLGLLFSDSSIIARTLIALIITFTSLWFGFVKLKPPKDDVRFIGHMLGLTVLFLLLSPTGYPWYVIWVLIFLPFRPNYGAALLCVTTSLYYLRYALNERSLTAVYDAQIIPLQYGLPLLIILAGWFVRRRRGEY